jgi:hypothetical protein
MQPLRDFLWGRFICIGAVGLDFAERSLERDAGQ